MVTHNFPLRLYIPFLWQKKSLNYTVRWAFRSAFASHWGRAFYSPEIFQGHYRLFQVIPFIFSKDLEAQNLSFLSVEDHPLKWCILSQAFGGNATSTAFANYCTYFSVILPQLVSNCCAYIILNTERSGGCRCFLYRWWIWCSKTSQYMRTYPLRSWTI